MVRVLFVCLGNICRSPAAEGILLAKIQAAQMSHQVLVDSAGTSAYHIGQPADARMRYHAERRGYHLPSTARQFQPQQDFDQFDYIVTMDESNYEDVMATATSLDEKSKIYPLVNFCQIHQVPRVPDPYYDGEDGFELVLDILEDGCEQILQHLTLELQRDKI